MKKSDLQGYEKKMFAHIPPEVFKRFRIPKKLLSLKELAILRDKLKCSFAQFDEWIMRYGAIDLVAVKNVGSIQTRYYDGEDIKPFMYDYYLNELKLHFIVFNQLSIHKENFLKNTDFGTNYKECRTCKGTGTCKGGICKPWLSELDMFDNKAKARENCKGYKENVCCICKGSKVDANYYYDKYLLEYIRDNDMSEKSLSLLSI